MRVYVRTVRLFFEKSRQTIYISHLDLSRAMGRAILRSGLPAWYTQGFNPHVYMTFALPLSLGVTGKCETMDFRLTEEVLDEAVTERLDRVLPDGLRVLKSAAPVMEPKKIFWADYQIDLVCDPEKGMKAIQDFKCQNEVMAQKRSKKGMTRTNIRPWFEILSAAEQKAGIRMDLRCRAGGEINLNPALVVDALAETGGFSVLQSEFARSVILTEGLKEFR